MSNEFEPKLKEKRYDPRQQEPVLFKKWQEEKLYRFNENSDKPIFIIDTPPPYTNAPWHMGGAIHYSQIDMIARTMRMKGYEVLFPMGLDRNGLPIEVQAERENNIRMQDVPREKFLELCQDILDRYGSKILNVCYDLGLSCDSFEWDEVYKTDDVQYRALTQETFIKLWHLGLIYEDNRPNIWDPVLQTTIADAEVEYKESIHTLYDIKFKVKETEEEIIISTTRPELLPAIGLVIFNPADKRYQHLEGKHAVVPLFDIEVPIMAHPQAQMDFGTGLVMICSFGDLTDVRIFRELQMAPRYVINPDGTMNENARKYQGLPVEEARKAIARDLEEAGFITNKKDIPYRQPISERSKAPVEFIGMPEYYLKQVEFVPKLKEYAQSVRFHPSHARQIWIDWLNHITMDWPISRRRYYGTEVPLWYCKKCKEPHVPEPGKYYQPWRDPAPFEKCRKCGHHEFEGDTRTFDTWMDSSISAIYVTLHPHNKRNEKFFTKILKDRPYICDLRPQGKDIVRTWFHYSMLRVEQLYQRPCFGHAWISGHVVAETGEKMSKSKGNVVQPEPMLEKYGGDALRFFGALEASHGSDIRFSENRLAGTTKFLNKLYNIARFISMLPEPSDDDEITYTATDMWIKEVLVQTWERAKQGYDDFNFHIPAKEFRGFTWEIFASHYIEMVKKRAYNRDGQFSTMESNGARKTLYQVLNAILRAIAPIAPFITDYIYRQIWNESVHQQKFPEFQATSHFEPKITTILTEFNSAIWKLKKDSQKSLREPVQKAIIPSVLRPFLNDLIHMHGIKEYEIKDITEDKDGAIKLIEGIFIVIEL